MAETSYKGATGKIVNSSYLWTTLQDLKEKHIDNKGASLSVNGKIVQLKDADGNVLSSITTQDTNTTYNIATTTSNGLMSSDMVKQLNNISSWSFESTALDLSALI